MTDEFSPLFRQTQDRLDGQQWEMVIHADRRKMREGTPGELGGLIQELATEHHVDPKLVEAVIGLESGGNPRAQSKKGAQGLMQLVPATARRFGVTDPFDMEQNLRGGIRYLAHLSMLFPGRPDLQLAGYHAGEGAVKAAGNQIPNTHDGNMYTAQYVQTVLQRYQSPDYRPGASGAVVPGVPEGMLDAGVPARPAPRLEDATQAPMDQRPMQPSALPSVADVDTALANPSPYPTRGRFDPTGRERAYAPIAASGEVEEADPTRSVGNFVSSAIRGLRDIANYLPTLSNAVQGPNQPGVLAGLATAGQDLAALLKPAEQATKPTMLDQTFWDKVVSTLGSSTPGLLAGIAAGGGIVGAGTNALLEAAQEAEQVRQQLTPLVGDQQAQAKSLKVFAVNAALVGITDKLGIFGDRAKPLRYLASSLVMNDLQEVAQYDITRRAMTVPANNKAAPVLERQGWQKDGDRLFQPWVMRDVGEVLAIATILGGVMSGAGLSLMRAAEQQIPAIKQAIETEQTEVASTIPETLVKDAQGRPLRVYHGTPAGVIQRFNVSETGDWGPGIYFTDDPAVATSFTQSRGLEDPALDLPTMYPAYLDMKRPLQWDVAQAEGAILRLNTALESELFAQQWTEELQDRSSFVEEGSSGPFATQSEAASALQMLFADDLQSFMDGHGLQEQESAIVNALSTYLVAHADGARTNKELYRSFLADIGVQWVTKPALPAGQITGQGLYNSLLKLTGGHQVPSPENRNRVTTLLQAANFDGLIVNRTDRVHEYVVFSPEQVIPAFSIDAAIQAAENPETPAPGVEPSVWQRWAQRLNDLLPPGRPGGGILGNQRGAIGFGPRPTVPPSAGADPTVRTGAEGLTPERYKTPDGRWRVPLRDMPPQELELLDFIRQQGGIKLTGEELRGEFTALITRKETGLGGLQNNSTGLSAQQMAEQASEFGFIPTPEKSELLRVLDQSVTMDRPTYSVDATGVVPLLDDPQVIASYQAVLDALDQMQPRTEEQVGGVRHRVDVHEEAAQMLFTLDDVREIYPNTTLNDTMVSALLQALNTLGVNMATAAQEYLDNGARLGSAEEQSLQSVMALFAELDPVRLGVSAAQSRGLGILNDPLSRYTQFLNNLHEVMRRAPDKTMKAIAQKIVGAQPPPERTPEYWRTHPEEFQALFDAVERLDPTPFFLEADPTELNFVPRSEQEQALIDAAYTSARAALSPADWRRMDQDRQYAQQQHQRMQERWAQRQLRERPAISFQLEAEDADLFTPPRSYDEQQLIDAAYTSARAALTPEEYRLLDENRAYAQAREERMLGIMAWRESMRSLREGQDVRREGYAGRPVDRPAGPRQEYRPATQQVLLDEYREVQQALQDYVEGRADADRGARLHAALLPYLGQEQQLVMTKVMAQVVKPGFESYFLELWYNAMLSNPATHAANALGNTVTTLWALPERWIAETLADEGGVARGETAAMLYGLTHGIQDAWTVALRSFQQGAPLSGVSKQELRPPAMTAQNLGLDPNGALGRFTDFWFEYVGAASGGRLPSRALMASDEFFKMLNYRMELNALAYRDATQRGYEGAAWAEHVQRVIDRPELAQLQEAAQAFGVGQTFQAAMMPGGLGMAVQGFANLKLGVFPVGRIILPYTQTPANIARYALERTPLGYFFQSVQADLDTGGARADIAHAKVALGTTAMLGMAGLAMSGMLVGRAPDDETLRELWLQEHPEYSVRLPGGVWVSYDRLDPIGMLAGMVADMAQIAGHQEVPVWERAIAAPLYAFMKNIGSKTYLDGLSRFFDAMSPRPYAKPERFGDQIFRFTSRTASGLLQPSALMAATARVLDPSEKDAKGIIDALYARVPGWRDDVPNKRSLGGEKLLRGYGMSDELLPNLLRAYWPLKLETAALFPADREILRNKMALNPPPRVLATQALRAGEMATGGEVDLRDYPTLTLTAAQYEKYVVLSSGNAQEAATLGLEVPRTLLTQLTQSLAASFTGRPPGEALSVGEFADWMVTTPEYKEATVGTGGGRELYMQTAILAYRGLGKQLLLAQDPALAQQVEQSTIQRTLQRLPTGQRGPVLQEMQRGFDEARPQVREELGLSPVAPGGARLRIGNN